MDEFLKMLSDVALPALLAGIATELVKRIPLKDYQESPYFGVIGYTSNLIIALVMTIIWQGTERIAPGPGSLITNWILVAGVSALGYKGIQKIIEIQRYRADGDEIRVDSISGGNVSIGRESNADAAKRQDEKTGNHHLH